MNTINITNVKTIPCTIERPPSTGFETRRGLCTNLPYNQDMLCRLQVVVNNITEGECKNSFFEGDYDVIDNIDDLKKILSEVLIRFDTSPDYYTKSDYAALISVLYQSLLYLYQSLSISSTNEDVLEVEATGNGTELRPQIGYLDESAVESVPENNDKRIATIGDIRNYINNKLTWIEQ